jgi:hypothetical protein
MYPGLPQTNNPPASVSQVLGLQECTTASSRKEILENYVLTIATIPRCLILALFTVFELFCSYFQVAGN